MKRLFSVALFGFGGVAMLAGCPIYSERTYTDPDPYVPTSNACKTPASCANGTTCGADGYCHSNGCDVVGCPGGFQCQVLGGRAECVIPSGVDAGTDSSRPPFSGCRRDSECADAGTGAKCLSGVCTAAADQCSDATQCRSGQLCVDGSCTPACSASKACPTGYACDLNKGVCTQNPAPCTSGQLCGGGNTCVEDHCVPQCGAGGTCTGGLVCVDNGCVPDERPVFSCVTDGELGDGSSGKCASGSICLRRSCYIACDPLSSDACKNADAFNQCKNVTTSSGPHDVCGSATNLGTECDVAASKPCSGTLICIDGFCR